jgi:hypothetical protein
MCRAGSSPPRPPWARPPRSAPSLAGACKVPLPGLAAVLVRSAVDRGNRLGGASITDLLEPPGDLSICGCPIALPWADLLAEGWSVVPRCPAETDWPLSFLSAAPPDTGEVSPWPKGGRGAMARLPPWWLSRPAEERSSVAKSGPREGPSSSPWPGLPTPLREGLSSFPVPRAGLPKPFEEGPWPSPVPAPDLPTPF